MAVRDRAHRLIDELPERDLPTAERLLRGLMLTLEGSGGAFEAAPLAAPVDDEPETPQEAERVAQGWDDVRAGRVRRRPVRIG